MFMPGCERLCMSSNVWLGEVRARQRGAPMDIRSDAQVSDPTANVPRGADRPKARARGTRLAILLILLFVATFVYLPIRQERLNDTLEQAILQVDEAEVHSALRWGADSNLRVGRRPDGRLSLLDYLRY